ncbi:uncharacterized protein Tco025E_01205 [Trypanosoma conorhini]|uniref:Uncharacterized protein n=1 Tax=Trypanosoma conorhini TaxID=83891 RepID=A0A422Q987_9TRYP|nr:uncharacterized protein Tco025E_01205 [Trypanosoma conorhini]RNF26500.1 hypothetical protein Tco025E_01205 [Trypanosoma conorhini]
MDKSKTLEVLRGMKFMQRKEETKRRELFELDQQKRLEEQLQAASGAGNGVSGVSIAQSPLATKRCGATILYDTGFPRESYNFARRSFLRKVSYAEKVADTSTAAGAAEGTSDGAGCGGKEKSASSETPQEGPHRGDAEGAPSDGGEGDATEYDPTAVCGGDGGKRFCVNLRAPALPKGLAKQVAAEKRQKRRRQEETGGNRDQDAV